jgi:dihydrodiol dehydrogenase / D-xylose 1-dehydrogenase (NADP)
LDGQEAETVDVKYDGNGLAYQADECARAIRDGRFGCPDSSLEDSLAIMEIMDETRRQGGFSFPGELEQVL